MAAFKAVTPYIKKHQKLVSNSVHYYQFSKLITYAEINVLRWQGFHQIDTILRGVASRLWIGSQFVAQRFVQSSFGCLHEFKNLMKPLTRS